MSGGPTVVWFKRDLRTTDHAPLYAACETDAAGGAGVVCLFLVEPEMLTHPHAAVGQWRFILPSLQDLDRRLRTLGGGLLVLTGDAVDRLRWLHARLGFTTLRSHEEVGHAVSFARDQRVRRWAREAGVRWIEDAQSGVVRGPHDRDRWAKHWNHVMTRPLVPEPARVPALQAGVEGLEPGGLPTLETLRGLGLRGAEMPEAERWFPGGAAAGERMLHGFLHERGKRYRSEMSSPVTAWESSSRTSPYLAYGCLSVRQVYQAYQARSRALKAVKKDAPDTEDGARVKADATAWLQSMSSFASRLRWHCHFIQKFEDEPDLEFQNMNRAFDGLRGDSPEQPLGELDPARFEAWRTGTTGYPLVDACMRSLEATGWLNFRMRAMLASFSSYHLWQHWKAPADFLASRFLDYETGIHFSQFQMQSGTTGINTVRIYSPIKQVSDQDPEGRFIRRWVPELVPLCDDPVARQQHLPNPATMPGALQRRLGVRIGIDYPAPVVDHAQAYRAARSKMQARKSRKATREASAAVYIKHGSRKRPRRAGSG